MIAYFPTPYPDELFYSICARRADHLGYPNGWRNLDELSGTNHKSQSLEFPSKLGYLISNLPSKYGFTTDYFIKNHSFFPIYAPFLWRYRGVELWQRMIGDNAVYPPTTRKYHERRAHLRPFKYCPTCARIDREIYGETYWHRTHQLREVKLCSTHNVFLVDTPTLFDRSVPYSAEKTIPSTDSIFLSPKSGAGINPIYLHIAKELNWLSLYGKIGNDKLIGKYRDCVSRLGFVRASVQLKNSEFTFQFIEFYGSDVLEQHDAQIQNISNNWLTNLLFGSKFNPVRHLLLINFLGYTVEEFIGKPTISRKHLRSRFNGSLPK